MKKATIIGGIAVVIILLGLANALERSAKTEKKEVFSGIYATTTVTTGDLHFVAEIADTDEARIQGLSDRRSIGESEAMLFVFPKSDFYGFWMKDMRFSIDIIGLDAKKRAIWLQEYMTPWSYPEVFTPPRPVQYVLEVKSGTIKDLKITENQQFVW